MRTFNIKELDEGMRLALQEKIDNLTKPKGSLGRLEELALQIGMIQHTLTPQLIHPQNVIFCADHGIEREGVSLSPRCVTWQQTLHFIKGKGGGVNFLSNQHGFTLKVVDAGVDYDLPSGTGIIDMKIRKGTDNFRFGPAMSFQEMERCIESGARIVDLCHQEGSNVLSFGEMGIGNTSPSSIWMHLFTGIPLRDCTGAGSGLDKEGILHKLEVLEDSLLHFSHSKDPWEIIRWFGGFEMVMAIGAMLRAAERGILILVDGFIMTACMLAASKIHPEVLSYAIFCHSGDESGHRLMLDAMNAKPLLSLGLRLGEGTGAILAYPIVASAVHMINEMDSFNKAVITKYF